MEREGITVNKSLLVSLVVYATLPPWYICTLYTLVGVPLPCTVPGVPVVVYRALDGVYGFTLLVQRLKRRGTLRPLFLLFTLRINPLSGQEPLYYGQETRHRESPRTRTSGMSRGAHNCSQTPLKVTSRPFTPVRYLLPPRLLGRVS